MLKGFMKVDEGFCSTVIRVKRTYKLQGWIGLCREGFTKAYKGGDPLRICLF